jgi:hypothetical protein
MTVTTQKLAIEATTQPWSKCDSPLDR